MNILYINVYATETFSFQNTPMKAMIQPAKLQKIYNMAKISTIFR